MTKNKAVKFVVDQYSVVPMGLEALNFKDRCHLLMSLADYVQRELALAAPRLADDCQMASATPNLVSEVRPLIGNTTTNMVFNDGVGINIPTKNKKAA